MLFIKHKLFCLVAITGLVATGVTSHTWVHMLILSLVILAGALCQQSSNPNNTTTDQHKRIQQTLDQTSCQLASLLKEETDHIDENVARIKTLIHESSEQLYASFDIVANSAQQQRTKTKQLYQQLMSIGDTDRLMSTINAVDINTLHEDKHLLADLLAHVQTINQHIVQTVADMTAISETISAEINHSIQAIQCEDIVNQLASGMQSRLGHINEISHSLLPGGQQGHDSQHQLDHTLAKLTQLRQSFQNKRITEKVAQTSLQEGDIELF